MGHDFGPNSAKMEDCFLRLDKELGDFFAYLDKNVGKGAYLVFLTADHGVAHNAKFLSDKMQGKEGNRQYTASYSATMLFNSLNSHLKKTFGIDSDFVRGVDNSQIYFNYKTIKAAKMFEKIDLIRQATVEYIRGLDYVNYVVESSKISEATIPAVIKEKMINGYNWELSGDIQFLLKPGNYFHGDKGTTHGAWNPHDSHIPLVWMGWGIKHGSSNREVYITDIASTIAALLHVQMPNGCIGKPITEIFGE